MRAILTSRKGLHYESAKRGEATVLYIPGQDDPRVYRDLEGKSQKEIAERYGATGKKPLIRPSHGEVHIYGILNDDIAARRHGVKVYLPQDFAPKGTHAFYYLLGKKHIVHGVRIVDDSGEERWGNSLITLQGGDPIKIVTSAISERMLDGDADGICIAVDDNLEVYEGLKDALKPFKINVTPFASLNVGPKITPLYRHKDNNLIMLLAAFLMMLICSAAGFFWWVNQQRVDQLNQKINRVRQEISNIQGNEKLGHIVRPNDFLDAMKQPIKRPPSGFMNAGSYAAKEFGSLQDVTVQLNSTTPNNGFEDPLSINSDRHSIVTMFASVTTEQAMLLVDQEILARSVTASRPWLRKIENVSDSTSQVKLMLDMKVLSDEEGAQ